MPGVENPYLRNFLSVIVVVLGFMAIPMLLVFGLPLFLGIGAFITTIDSYKCTSFCAIPAGLMSFNCGCILNVCFIPALLCAGPYLICYGAFSLV
jgi:hypothetical protein